MGAWEYPRASTVASQPLDRVLPPWLANTHNPAMSPHFRHPPHWWNSGIRKIRDGRGEKLKQPLHRLLHQHLTKDSKISVQSYHIPLACTYGIYHWMSAKLVDPSNAKLTDRFTAKFVNHLTAKVVNGLTATVTL